VMFLINSIKSIKRNPDSTLHEYSYGIFLSQLTFLLSGLAGRSVFPRLPTTYIWIIIALSNVIFAMSESKRGA